MLFSAINGADGEGIFSDICVSSSSSSSCAVTFHLVTIYPCYLLAFANCK